MQKAVFKTPKPAGVMGIVMGGVFLVFGCAMFIVIAQDQGVELLPLYLFAAVWVIVCLGIMIISALNMRKSGFAIMTVESEGDPAQETPAEEDPIDRLRKLNGLKKDGSISAEEFKLKRAEIMKRKW